MEFYVYCLTNKMFLDKDVERTFIDFHTGEPIKSSGIVANTIKFTTNILEAGHSNEMYICDICDDPVWKKLGLIVIPVAIDDEYTKAVETLTESCRNKDVLIDDLTEEVKLLKDELQKDAATIAKLVIERNSLKERVRKLKIQANSIYGFLSSIGCCDDRVKELESENVDLRKDIETLKSKYDKLKTYLDTIENTMKSYTISKLKMFRD